MEQTLERISKERDAFYKRGIELSALKHESDDTGEICAAFAQAQGEFTPIHKDTKGYNYKYAQLDQVLTMLRPILSKHGLSLSQFTDHNDYLFTKLRHSSGQWFQSWVKIPQISCDNKRSFEQAWGSAITYMRRYQALGICGIHPAQEDSDGAY